VRDGLPAGKLIEVVRFLAHIAIGVQPQTVKYQECI